MIDSLKDNITKVLRDNKDIQERTGRIQARIIEKNKKIFTVEQQTTKAQMDKLEIMRDLATYEANFGQKDGLQIELQNLKARIRDSKLNLN